MLVLLMWAGTMGMPVERFICHGHLMRQSFSLNAPVVAKSDVAQSTLEESPCCRFESAFLAQSECTAEKPLVNPQFETTEHELWTNFLVTAHVVDDVKHPLLIVPLPQDRVVLFQSFLN